MATMLWTSWDDTDRIGGRRWWYYLNGVYSENAYIPPSLPVRPWRYAHDGNVLYDRPKMALTI